MTYRNYGPISKSFRYYRRPAISVEKKRNFFSFPWSSQLRSYVWEFGNAREGQKSELMAEKFLFDVR